MTRYTSTSDLIESVRTRAIREHAEKDGTRFKIDEPVPVGPLVLVALYRTSLLADCMEQLTAAGHTAAPGEVGATASPRAQRVPPPADATGNARVDRGASRSIQKRRPRR